MEKDSLHRRILHVQYNTELISVKENPLHSILDSGTETKFNCKLLLETQHENEK